MAIEILKILALAFLQNVSFSIVSRSRNRNNVEYHVFAAIFSNGIWFMTMRELVVSQLSWVLAMPYIAGTVIGSVVGVSVSMRIEKWLGAESDSHLKQKH